MRATHWTPGDQRKQTSNGGHWRTACARWVHLDRTAIPDRVTCKQCRRYLERLIVDGERLRR